MSLPTRLISKKSTKDLIIDLLGREWPLSAKEIYNKIIRESGKSISYQAVHKTISRMFEEKVLKKEGSKYSLDEKWIKSLKISAEFLESKYAKENKEYNFFELLTTDCVVYKFYGILELARFLMGVFFKLPNPDKKPSVNLWNFSYSIVGLKDEDYVELKEGFERAKTYAFVTEDNLLDQMFAKALKDYGIKEIKLGVKGATPLQDTMVFGDYTAHIWYPPEFRAAWFKQNRTPKKMDDFDLSSHLVAMRDDKCHITVVISKDEELADQIRAAYIGTTKGLPL